MPLLVKSGKETQEKVDNAQEQAQVEITNAQVKADEKVAEARNDFDKTREDYRHTMQSNLDALDKNLSNMDAKALKATGAKKVELTDKATTLRAQRDAFAADVRGLDNATAATLDATKIHMEQGVVEHQEHKQQLRLVIRQLPSMMSTRRSFRIVVSSLVASTRRATSR